MTAISIHHFKLHACTEDGTLEVSVCVCVCWSMKRRPCSEPPFLSCQGKCRSSLVTTQICSHP